MGMLLGWRIVPGLRCKKVQIVGIRIWWGKITETPLYKIVIEKGRRIIILN